MIVFSRKVGEAIIIGDCIVVTVVEIRGDQVRIGIEAPREWTVCRTEVFNARRGAGRSQPEPQQEQPQRRRSRLWRWLFGE